MAYKRIAVPASGEKIQVRSDGSLLVADCPVIPYIEGDGIGVDITPVMRRVVDAVVERAYAGSDGQDRQRELPPLIKPGPMRIVVLIFGRAGEVIEQMHGEYIKHSHRCRGRGEDRPSPGDERLKGCQDPLHPWPDPGSRRFLCVLASLLPLHG